MLPTLSDEQRARLAPFKRPTLYVIGVFIVMNGLGYFAVYSYIGGALMIASGVFIFPQVRVMLETHLGVSFSTLTALGVFGLLFLAGSAISLTAVDLSNAPDIITPFR